MVKNETPKIIQQNNSNVYPISIEVRNTRSKVIPDSYSASIVIDGKRHKMAKMGKTSFTFNYEPSGGRHKTSYYFDINYISDGILKTYTSEIYQLSITNRYVVGFECNRGRPYTQVSLLGRGFADGDTVEIGGVFCDTEFVSPNVLKFIVPFLEGGRNYRAVLYSNNGDIGLGDFLIDAAKINVEPASVALKSGERQIFTISSDIDAPEEGLPLEITTDIPESIIMHDVTIRSGEKSANVLIGGGEPGIGTLFIEAPGFEECRIPVTIYGESDIDSRIDDEVADFMDDFFPED
jgi:hypothetical protein